MEKSIVYFDTLDNKCCYAIVDKREKGVIIILNELECVIFDYDDFSNDNFNYKYLLIKYYDDFDYAYKDFLKLIGKMCKKNIESKYFKNHIKEDNSISFVDFKIEHAVSSMDLKYEERYKKLIEYIKNNKEKFIKD